MAGPGPYVIVDEALDGLSASDHVVLPAAAAHHLTRVLRRRDGDTVVIADGAGWHGPGVLSGGAVGLTQAPSHVPAPTPRITIWQAVGKGRKHDEVVRTVTELGADEVVAVTTDHAISRPAAGKRDALGERWTAVARAACEQARRPWLPQVSRMEDLQNCLATAADQLLLIADPLATTTIAAVEGIGKRPSVVVAIGPEGGFSDDERSAFLQAGGRLVSLGPWVLRTEHAAAAATAVLRAGLTSAG